MITGKQSIREYNIYRENIENNNVMHTGTCLRTSLKCQHKNSNVWENPNLKLHKMDLKKNEVSTSSST